MVPACPVAVHHRALRPKVSPWIGRGSGPWFFSPCYGKVRVPPSKVQALGGGLTSCSPSVRALCWSSLWLAHPSLMRWQWLGLVRHRARPQA